MDKKYLDAKGIMKFLGDISRATLARWQRDGMPYVKARGKNLYDPDEVQQWLHKQSEELKKEK